MRNNSQASDHIGTNSMHDYCHGQIFVHKLCCFGELEELHHLCVFIATWKLIPMWNLGVGPNSNIYLLIGFL